MSTRRAVTTRLALALAAASLLFPAACSSPHPATPPPAAQPWPPAMPYPGPRPDTIAGATALPAAPAPPATASPDQVAEQALRVMFTWYTDRDSGPATATRRALAYLAEPMSTDVMVAPPVAAPGADWTSWAAHHAVLTPTITPGHDDAPPAAPSQAYRQYQIVQTVRGADGWTAPAATRTVFVTLSRTPSGWRITQINQT